MRLADVVRRQLKSLNPVERKNEVHELRETITAHNDELACSRCGSVAMIKKGRAQPRRLPAPAVQEQQTYVLQDTGYPDRPFKAAGPQVDDIRGVLRGLPRAA